MAAARTPEDCHRCFAAAFAAKDLAALVALYEAEPSIVTEPGQPPATGRVALRALLTSLLASDCQLHQETTSVIRAGDLALLRATWRLTGTGPEGEALETSHNSIEVVRRQADGTWLFVIDDPFGAD